jgi:hypothetical protein
VTMPPAFASGPATAAGSGDLINPLESRELAWRHRQRSSCAGMVRVKLL